MEKFDLVFQDVIEVGSPRKRVGKSKVSGVRLVEIVFDEEGRQVEEYRFNDDGALRKRIVYVHDGSRKPLLTTAYDASGKVIFRQERGKRPEVTS
jgi:hypothetical protein